MNSYITIGIGIIFMCVGYAMHAPTNATVGYHILSILLPLIGYSAILAIIALAISAIGKRIREWWLPIFAILFILAAMTLLIAAAARTRVSVDVGDTLRQVERREGMPIGDYLDQQLAQSREIIAEIDRRGWRQAIEKDEGKRLEQLPISELKSYLAYIRKVED